MIRMSRQGYRHMDEVSFTIAAAGASALVPIITELISKFFPGIFSRTRGGTEESYSKKLSKLAEKLEGSSREVDGVLREITSVMSERRGAVEKLETQLMQLTAEEESVRRRIAALKETRIEVAEHFAAAVSSGERRSARRDYALFGAGVFVSTIISIVLQLAQ